MKLKAKLRWPWLRQHLKEQFEYFMSKGWDNPSSKEIYARSRAKINDIVLPSKFRLKADALPQLKIDPRLFTETHLLKQHNRANWADCDPRIGLFYGHLYARMRALGFPVYCHTCYRSLALQRRLHEEGQSKLSSGAHQRGMAIDVVHSYYHWNSPDEFWDLIGFVGKDVAKKLELKINWGGDERDLGMYANPKDRFRWDPAHWELIGWRQAPVINPKKILNRTPMDWKKNG